MASLLDSKAVVGLACVVAVVIGAGSVVWLHGGGEAPPSTAPAAVPAGWNGPVGPGQVAPDTEGPSLTDASGNLRIDAGLRTLFDSYLKTGRAVQLHAWLNGRLAPPARAQAADLVDAYMRYLRAEQEMRAQARFTRPDPAGLSDRQVEQMLVWQQERAGLRDRMLGMAVAQALFGEDDGACRNALEDWRRMRAPEDSEDVDSNELRARRLHGAVLEQGRNERAQACARRLIDDYSGEKQ